MSAVARNCGDTEILQCSERGNGIIEFTLNRAGAFNSLSSSLMLKLQNQLNAINQDPKVRVAIISGSGPGFCSGHDLKEVSNLSTSKERRALLAQCSKLMMTIVHSPKPLIAKVHGAATAAGCQLVASCDLAIATSDTIFATPGVNIGLFCSTPMVALSRNISRKHAMEMLLVGDEIDAVTAARFGLINKHVENESLDDSVMEVAEKISSKSSHTISIGKKAFYNQLELDIAAAYEYATEVMVENLLAKDANEGMSAFLEKRQPEWKDE